MFKYTALALLSLFSNTYSNGITITCEDNKVCSVRGNSSLTVLASNKVPVLIIECLDCKSNNNIGGIKVYSSANKTFINCEEEDSCDEVEFNFGVAPPKVSPRDYPLYTTAREEVVINCAGKQACKAIRINTEGEIKKGLIVSTSSTEEGSIMDGIIYCGSNRCVLNCGTSDAKDTCKNANCFGKGCVCQPSIDTNGDSSCPENFNISPTPRPTESPVTTTAVIPTARPTPSPTDHRNSTACDHDGCIIEPEENYDVECGESYRECNVMCTDENQCQDGVIIQANSRVVNLECRSINSCDKVVIITSTSNTVNIILSGETSAENMVIIAQNPASIVNIIASGAQSFTNGKLYCDAKCNLRCGAGGSCENTVFECLTVSRDCVCDGPTCPLIQNFGDQSCEDKSNCLVTPDGSSRIVALNNVDTLTVDCTVSPQQCKQENNGLRIFTAAKTTIVKCNNIDGCEGMSIFAGDLRGRSVPKGFKASEFVVSLNKITNEKQTLQINCDAESACKDSLVYTTGNVETKILGDGENTLQEAILKCDNCKSLEFECLDFEGCIDTRVFCPKVGPLEQNRCVCNNIFVEVNLTTTVTEVPRNTCPIINEYGVVKRESINANIGENTVKTGVKVVQIIGIIIGIALVLLIVGYMIIKCGKDYEQIKDAKNDGLVALNNNNNQHSLNFQVEMN